MNMGRIVWIALWIGMIIIILSWMKIVPWQISRFKFCLACVAVVVQVIAKYREPEIKIITSRLGGRRALTPPPDFALAIIN